MKYSRCLRSFLLAGTFFIYTNSFCQSTDTGTVRGTTVLTFIKKDSIIIAADSKMLVEFPDTSWNSRFFKIAHYKNIFFSSAGMSLFINKRGDTLFNAASTMIEMLKEYSTIDKAIKYYNEKSVAVINSLYEANPASFDKNNILEFEVITFQNGAPYFKFWQYMVDGRINKVVALEQKGNKTLPFIHFMGNQEFALEKVSGWFASSTNHIATLIKLIKLEISNDKKHLGEPIDVITIYPNKHFRVR
ncbi:MAG: hypothetical protein ABI688_07770 [Bacteroidota bacterium]